MGLLALLLVLASAFELPLTRFFPSAPIAVLDLENQENIRYQASVLIGSPPQAFSLTLDTVFPYLVVDDAVCWECTAPKRFNRTSSATYMRLRSTKQGNVSAALGQDDVVLGSQGNLRVANQTMISMLEKPLFGYDGSDGLLVIHTQGLGFERPLTGDLNLAENLKKQGVISSAVFAVYLDNRYTFDSPNDNVKSVVSFGSWNLSAYSTETDFAFVSVNTTAGLWELNLQAASIGEVDVVMQPQRAIIDSAQNLLVLPEVEYHVIHEEICKHLPIKCKERTTKWKCKSGIPSGLPDIILQLDDYEARITPRNYLDVWNEQCHLRIASQEGLDYWVLGTGFMHEYYMLFDIENSRLGLAPVTPDQTSRTGIITLVGLLAGVGLFAVIVFVVRMKIREASLAQPFLSCG